MAPPDVLTGRSVHARHGARQRWPLRGEERQAAMAAAGSGVQLKYSARRSFNGTAARRPKQGGDFLGEVVLISLADHNDHVRQQLESEQLRGQDRA